MARRDDDRYATFVIASRDGLLKTAYLLTSGDERRALDIAREALVRTYLAWPRSGQEGAADQAVSALASAATSAERSLARRRPQEPAADGAARAGDHPPAEPPTEKGRVLAALRSLTPQQRACITLRYYQRRSLAQTAALLACSVATATRATSEAMTALQQALDSGIGRPTAARPERLPANLTRLLDSAAEEASADTLDPAGLIELGARRQRQRRSRSLLGAAAVTALACLAGVAIIRSDDASTIDDRDRTTLIDLRRTEPFDPSAATTLGQVRSGRGDRAMVVGLTSDGHAIVDRAVPGARHLRQLSLQDLTTGRRMPLAGSRYDGRQGGVTTAAGTERWVVWAAHLRFRYQVYGAYDRRRRVSRTLLEQQFPASSGVQIMYTDKLLLTSDDQLLLQGFSDGGSRPITGLYAVALDGTSKPRLAISGALGVAVRGTEVTYFTQSLFVASLQRHDLATGETTTLGSPAEAGCGPLESGLGGATLLVLEACSESPRQRLVVASADGNPRTVLGLRQNAFFTEVGVTGRYLTLEGSERFRHGYLFDARSSTLYHLPGREQSLQVLQGNPEVFAVTTAVRRSPTTTLYRLD